MNVKTALSFSILTATLLGGTALVGPQSAIAAASEFKAQTGWAISRVASVSRGSYCAMAQKYDSNTIMTIARNDKNEYSLAFDFQAPKFSIEKELTASVKAGAGSAQTYTVRPQSPQAVVLPLGANEAFMNNLKKTGKVTLDIDGASYAFTTEKFGEAQDEMSTCMASMNAPQPAAAAPTETSAALSEAKEKVAAIAAQPAAASLSAEDLVAAPVDEPAPEQQLKSENEKLKQAMADTRKSYENEMSERSGPAVPELQEKIHALELENARLNSEAKKAAVSAATVAELEKNKAELARANEQAKAMEAQLAAAAAEKEEAAKVSQGLQLSKREVDALKAENQTLKNQMQISAKAEAKPSAPDPVVEQELAYLRAENEKLVKDLAAAQNQKPSAAPAADQNIAALQSENEALKARLAEATITPMPSTEDVGAPGDEKKLRDQMRDVRSQLELAEAENAGLRKQVENLQKDSEGSQLKMAGGSWDLEQATRRYQESQREIRRLGALLEQDRVKCQEEKKNIEYMLFDPEVAKPAQISMLGSLEDQIIEKDGKIAELENALKSARMQPAAGEVKSSVMAQKDVSEDSAKSTIEPEKLLAAAVAPAKAEVPPVATATAQPLPVAPAVEAQPLPVPAPVAAAPVAAVAPAIQPAPLQPQDVAVQAQPLPLAAVPDAVKFQSPQEFAALLSDAGIGVRGVVQPVQKASSDSYKAYSWQTDSLYGSAEQRQMKDRGGFESAVQQYLDRAKSRCSGEFAAVPAQLKSAGSAAEGYEIACVSGQSGSSASVLFSYNQGIMTTVAHEGRAEAMDIAMDARDRVAAKISAN